MGKTTRVMWDNLAITWEKKIYWRGVCSGSRRGAKSYIQQILIHFLFRG